MPDYTVKVQYQYPVQALSAEDALATVPHVIKGRFIGFHGDGLVEIVNADGKLVLTTELVTKEKVK